MEGLLVHKGWRCDTMPWSKSVGGGDSGILWRTDGYRKAFWNLAVRLTSLLSLGIHSLPFRGTLALQRNLKTYIVGAFLLWAFKRHQFMPLAILKRQFFPVATWKDSMCFTWSFIHVSFFPFLFCIRPLSKFSRVSCEPNQFPALCVWWEGFWTVVIWCHWSLYLPLRPSLSPSLLFLSPPFSSLLHLFKKLNITVF